MSACSPTGRPQRSVIRWTASAGGDQQPLRTAIVAQHDEHALPHRPLRRPEHRARLLLLHRQRRPRAGHGRREPADPHDERTRPDLAAPSPSAHPELRRGDAFLHNSPYHGNSHAADHCILVPVVDDDGVHRFTVLAKAHQADCGNSQPTTYMGDARDVYEEGALIFAAVRVQTDYADIEDIVRMLAAAHPRARPVVGRLPRAARRRPHRRARDARARRGGRLGRAGRVRPANGSTTARTRMADAIATLPAGTIDRDHAARSVPRGARTAFPISVGDRGRPRDGTIDVDLRDNVDCLPSGLNLTESTARTAAMMGVFNAIGAGRAAERRQLPPHPRSAARELRGRRSPPSAQLLGRDDQPRRPGRQRRAAGVRGARRRHRHGRVRAVIPAAAAVISGRDPRTDGGLRQPDLPCGHRRRRDTVDGRLADDLPRRLRGGCFGATASRLPRWRTRSWLPRQQTGLDTEGAGRLPRCPVG